jgi:hypothetical protein
VYLLPSGVVADVLARSHQQWLANPGVKGQPHKDTPMRRLLPDYGAVFRGRNPYPLGWLDKYCDAWDTLRLSATNAEKRPPALHPVTKSVSDREWK